MANKYIVYALVLLFCVFMVGVTNRFVKSCEKETSLEQLVVILFGWGITAFVACLSVFSFA